MSAQAATRRVLTTQVPGVAPAQVGFNPDAPTNTETDADALLAATEGLEGQAEPQLVTMTVAQLTATVQREIANALAARQAGPPKEADLPDQSEIDPRTITRPTLSKQGYVVPIKYGEPADPSIKR